MPISTNVGKTDLALTSAANGTFARASAPGSVAFAAVATADVAGLADDLAAKADDTAVVKLTGDQTKTDVLTLDGATIKPDVTPIHWRTTAGVDRRGHTFTVTTNGGYPFTDGVDTLYDDIKYWGWNLGGALSPDHDPTHPTWYDSMEDAYLQPDGSILGEWNLEGNGPGWSQLMRWRSLSFNQADGHGAIVYAVDYFRQTNQTVSFTAFDVGADIGYRIGPFGVYEVEKTAGGTGYTNGTGYALIFSGGGGTGAAGTFNVVGGAVTNIALTQSGKNYTTAPTVSFANGGAGTGATANVLTGSISSYLPLNCRQPIGATEFILADTSGSQRTYLVGAIGSAGQYGGYNIIQTAGVFSARETGAVSGVSLGSSGSIDWFATASVSAGTTVTPKISLAANGALIQRITSTGIAYKIQLPAVQTDDVMQVLKSDGSTYLFHVTKDGWIGINPGVGAQAPIDLTKATSGTMARFGANGVTGLCTISYDADGLGDISFQGSSFGPTQIKSGTNQDINLKPNGTAKVAITGKLALPTSTDANIPNGGIAWSSDTVGALKVRTPAGVLRTITFDP